MNGMTLLQKRVLLHCLICILLLYPLGALAESVTYQYDAHHRLTGATYGNGKTFSYTYDVAGNHLQKTVAVATAPSAPQGNQAASAALNMTTMGSTQNTATQQNESSNLTAASNDAASLLNSGSSTKSNNSTQKTLENDTAKTATPATVVYENAEDGQTSRWRIEAGPAWGYIYNTYDSGKGSQVVEVRGDGLLSGFQLLKSDGTLWNDTSHQIIQWSMKFTNDFVISVAAQTTNGLRYFSFTPEEGNVVGSSTDIFQGLGVGSKDGKWRTYIVDLAPTLHAAQPNTTILALLGFYVSGNGMLDDIQTHKDIPATLNSSTIVLPGLKK